MKSLKDYITEAQICEAKGREEIRIEVKDIKNSDEFLKNLRSKLNENNIYNEEIDKGLKFAIQGDDKEKYQSILDMLKEWEPGAEKLESSISKLENWINEPVEDDKKEEDDKNKEKKEEE